MLSSRGRLGFTIIEMLVVVGIISLLAAIMLPALSMAREAARTAACQRNLQQFGIGLQVHANNHQEQMCSGAFDWLNDGAVTEVGWVADLVNAGTAVGKMTCATNPSRLADTYHDLLTADAGSFPGNLACVNRVGSPPVTLPDGSLLANPCWEIAVGPSAGAPSSARRQLIEDRIFKKLYNTNYTASWFLVRSEANLDANGNLVRGVPACGSEITSRNTTRGPLRRSMADTAKVSSALIPLLADGGISLRSLTDRMGGISPGTPLTASFTRGPVLRQTTTYGSALNAPVFPVGTDRSVWWPVWNRQVLQDYQNFGPVHRGICNVLFADGSVRPVTDTNQDGALNNGFGAVGSFGSDQKELQEDDVFSLYSVDALRP